jgi:toxin ParE1/3/4
MPAATAFSILLFTKGSMSSGFFPKKKPPCTIYQWQHVNRKCSNQLRGIFDSIADDNAAAAERTVRRMRDAIQRTSRMPHAGRIGRVAGTREIAVSATPYLVVYRIVENSIHILAFLLGAQQWPESF